MTSPRDYANEVFTLVPETGSIDQGELIKHGVVRDSPGFGECMARKLLCTEKLEGGKVVVKRLVSQYPGSTLKVKPCGSVQSNATLEIGPGGPSVQSTATLEIGPGGPSVHNTMTLENHHFGNQLGSKTLTYDLQCTPGTTILELFTPQTNLPIEANVPPVDAPTPNVTYITGKPIVCNPQMKLNVKKLTADAILPTRGSKFSAGYDLAYSRDEPITIPPRSRALVPIDIAIEDIYAEYTASVFHPPLRDTYYLRVAPRSGLAVKHGIDVGAGVIDQDYRGPVGVVLFNFGDSDFVINKGDRVAQLIIELCAMLPVAEVTELSSTERGSGGFGSTGAGTRPRAA